MSKADITSDASVIRRIIVEQGLASSDEVDDCFHTWSDPGSRSGETLTGMLIKKGVVTAKQMRRVRKLMDERLSAEQIPGYELMEKLGSGAMADVFRARQLSLDREVAIKILPKRFNEDPNFVDRFYAEGRAAAKLNHPNIVQAIDVGAAGDRHYFVMEIVEGHTVFDHLQKNGRYEEKEAVRIVMLVAEALRHAHEKGFIHRDVKPKNIMINEKGVAKLADMGLARQISDREAAEAEAGKAFGTPFYISPEQIRGDRNIDARCDLYCLGATFYHMVTGRVPFDGPNPAAVMHKHLRADFVPPDHINPNLSSGLCEVIEVMMAKKPGDRYPSAAALLEDLRDVAEGNPPLQARKHFSMASLADLESSGVDESAHKKHAKPKHLLMQYFDQPLFWTVVVSVLLNVLLLLLMLIWIL